MIWLEGAVLEDGETPIYFEPPVIMDDPAEPPDISTQSGGGSGSLYSFEKFFSLVNCDQSPCPSFARFPIETPVNIFGVVAGIATHLQVFFYAEWHWDPFNWNFSDITISFCFSIDGWAAIMGGPGAYFLITFCGSNNNPPTQQAVFGVLNNASLETDGCLEVTQSSVDQGRVEGTLTATNQCCPGTVILNFGSVGTPAGNFFTPNDTDHVFLIPKSVTPDPASCQQLQVTYLFSVNGPLDSKSYGLVKRICEIAPGFFSSVGKRNHNILCFWPKQPTYCAKQVPSHYFWSFNCQRRGTRRSDNGYYKSFGRDAFQLAGYHGRSGLCFPQSNRPVQSLCAGHGWHPGRLYGQ